jgi:putative ABC transport system ATP-binding protein
LLCCVFKAEKSWEKMADEEKKVEDDAEVSIEQLQCRSKKLGEVCVELKDVSKVYKLEGGGLVPALRSISMERGTEFMPIRRGEFVMIRGPSGGGKTTLLNVIGTIDAPTSGELWLNGKNINFKKNSDKDLAALRLKKIGFVFQT